MSKNNLTREEELKAILRLRGEPDEETYEEQRAEFLKEGVGESKHADLLERALMLHRVSIGRTETADYRSQADIYALTRIRKKRQIKADNTAIHFSEWLRSHMKNQKLRLSELVLLSNVNDSRVRSIYYLKTEPTISEAIALCKALKRDIHQVIKLLYGE